jgi:hypothetical protein
MTRVMGYRCADNPSYLYFVADARTGSAIPTAIDADGSLPILRDVKERALDCVVYVSTLLGGFEGIFWPVR